MKRTPCILLYSHTVSILASLLVVFLLMMVSLSSTAETHSVGEKHFKQCASCHLPSGAGVPGMFPPLTKRLGPLVGSQKGRDYLVMVIQAGLMGRLSIGGTAYQGVMPAQGSSLGDDGVASVLNYTLQTFNVDTLSKKSRPFTTKEVASIKARYPNANSRDVYTLRQSIFASEK